jgi:hypothetical protein
VAFGYSRLFLPPIIQIPVVHALMAVWPTSAAMTGSPLILGLFELFGLSVAIGLFCLFKVFRWYAAVLAIGYIPAITSILFEVTMGAAGGT